MGQLQRAALAGAAPPVMRDVLLVGFAFLLGWNAHRWFSERVVGEPAGGEGDMLEDHVHQAAPDADPLSGYVLLQAIRQGRRDC